MERVLRYRSDNVTWDEVVPGLFQGDWPHPADLTEFDVLVSMTAEGVPPTPDARPDLVHLVCAIHDAEMTCPDEVRGMAREVARRHAHGERVLVHCAQGLNRSGVVVARALMFSGYSAPDAVRAVRNARGPWALCNEHFEAWLYDEARETAQTALWG